MSWFLVTVLGVCGSGVFPSEVWRLSEGGRGRGSALLCRMATVCLLARSLTIHHVTVVYSVPGMCASSCSGVGADGLGCWYATCPRLTLTPVVGA